MGFARSSFLLFLQVQIQSCAFEPEFDACAVATGGLPLHRHPEGGAAAHSHRVRFCHVQVCSQLTLELRAEVHPV